MTTPDTCSIWLPDAKSTHNAGVSLASSLYSTSLTIGLTGDLGAGKTSLAQGFLQGLGTEEHVTSPTYALEQRYNVENCEILHIDLYRLEPEAAEEFIATTDDFDGIRCIEWIDRCTVQPDILIHLSEQKDGRLLNITFQDAVLPTEEEILTWRTEVALTENVSMHCDAVANFCDTLSEHLRHRGILHRPSALRRAALVHDLLRFLDFVPGASYDGKDAPEAPEWEPIKTQFHDKHHEEACASWLRERGYTTLAQIVAPHGLSASPNLRTTIEQKVLYYADKRVRHDQVVTLDERFADFQKRYGNGNISESHRRWFAEAAQTEQELGF